MDDVPSKTVRFRVADVVHPRPVQVLMELFCQMSLEGQIVARTNNGATAYLVVRVMGLGEPVIVPQDKASDFFEDEGTLAGSAAVRK